MRVLAGNVIAWFESITPTFLADVKQQINKGLNPAIQYNITGDKIKNNEIPKLLGDQIVLFENYNQFLWCICYSLFVLFDEGINKPIIEKRFTGTMDLTNNEIVEAFGLFEFGTSLFKDYPKKELYLLANPELYDPQTQDYVNKTNALFVSAMVFTLLHEYAHFKGAHPTIGPPDLLKMQEYEADEFAYKTMAESFLSPNGKTHRMGIILGLCSLILYNKNLSGGNTHPDPEDRIVKAIEYLAPDARSYEWGIAGFALQVWGIEHGAELKLPAEFNDYKDSFYETLIAVKKHKRN